MDSQVDDYDEFNKLHNSRFKDAAARLQRYYVEDVNRLLVEACSPAIAEVISGIEFVVEDKANSSTASFEGKTTIRIGETLFDTIYAEVVRIESEHPQAPPALKGPLAKHLNELIDELRNDRAQSDGFGPSGPLAGIGPMGPMELRRKHYTLQYWMNFISGIAEAPTDFLVDEDLLDHNRKLKPQYQVPPDVQNRMNVVQSIARCFTIAHEHAHVLLGHTSAMEAIPVIAAQAKAIICSSGALADCSGDIELQADVIGLSMVIAVTGLHAPPSQSGDVLAGLRWPIIALGRTFDLAADPNHLRQLGSTATHPSASDRVALLLHTARFLSAPSHPNVCSRNN